MKLIPAILFILVATPALAHPTHVATTGGHDHIVAVVAITLALAVAWILARTVKKQSV